MLTVEAVEAPVLVALPVAVGVAILKYRLYDIDLIIRRTLIYGAMTAALALVYFSSVALLQTLFRSIIGQQQSSIVIVLSTLTIAALFAPLRRRVQEIVDRRFYRRKYNADQVLALFSARLREEVDLNQLTELLVVVV